jgi:hypothetical protein
MFYNSQDPQYTAPVLEVIEIDCAASVLTGSEITATRENYIAISLLD